MTRIASRSAFSITDPESEEALPLMIAMLSLLVVVLGMFFS